MEAWEHCRDCKDVASMKRAFVKWYIHQTKVDVSSDEFIATFKRLELWEHGIDGRTNSVC